MKSLQDVVAYLDGQANDEERQADSWIEVTAATKAADFMPLIHGHRYASMVLRAVSKVIQRDFDRSTGDPPTD